MTWKSRRRRAKELVKQWLQARHPKKDLKTATEDRVVTPTFTIVGRILTATIKAKAELFGDVELPVARMRALRSFTGAALEIDVTSDAARYANQGQWLETDFQVDGRTAVVVTAKGQVDVRPQQGGQFIVGPNGLQGRNQGMRAVMVAGQKLGGAHQRANLRRRAVGQNRRGRRDLPPHRRTLRRNARDPGQALPAHRPQSLERPGHGHL